MAVQAADTTTRAAAPRATPSACRPHPHQDTYATSKPKWVEWDSELPYNKNRTATLWNGTISIYQVRGERRGGSREGAWPPDGSVWAARSGRYVTAPE